MKREEILKAIDALGYNEPSDVQKRVIPEILSGKDVVVKSQTGSGKTAAFAIPLCEIIKWDDSKPQVLVLTPTRELAIQVKEEVITSTEQVVSSQSSVIQYKVLAYKNDLFKLEEDVTKHLNEGWDLVGGVSVSMTVSPYESVTVFAQSVVKH